MESTKQIETDDGIKGEYVVENRFSMKIWMTEPYKQGDKPQLELHPKCYYLIFNLDFFPQHQFYSQIVPKGCLIFEETREEIH